MIVGIACGVITSMFINHMCQMKALGPIISKVLTGYGLAVQFDYIMDCAKNKDWFGVAKGSVELLISLLSLHQNCFTGDTLVATEDGQVRIDEIKVGDKVWAYDIYTGQTALKEVTKVYVHEVDEILHVNTTEGEIDTTTNHPFYVIGEGWVSAGDLSVGDGILSLDGSVSVITGSEIEKLDESILVYNLEVADYNTYFVGDVPMLVHNYITKEDLYSTGNSKGPAKARPKDFGVESGSDIVGGNNNDGKSTYDIIKHLEEAGFNGRVWLLKALTKLPFGLAVKDDGCDKGGPHNEGHRTIYAEIEMTLDEFNAKLAKLKWDDQGKIK